MEDNQTTTTPQANPTFADVKLPGADSSTTVASPPQTSPTEFVAQPVPTQPTPVPVQFSETESSPASDQPSTPSNAVISPSAPTHKSGGGHKIAIVIAVIVFLALAGAVVYVYMQSNSGKITRKDSNVSTTTKPSNTIVPATTADVDEATKAIEDNLANIDADKDFMSSDLSDATLGL